MHTRFLAQLNGFLLLVLAALMVTRVLASVLSIPLHVLQALTRLPAQLAVFSVLMLILIILVLEWRTIIRYLQVESMSLAFIERTRPHLPGRFEIVATNLLTLLCIVLGIQFIATVYAMSLTLSSSTNETKDTQDIVLADFDGDGDLDYIAGNKDSGDTFHLDLYTNNGTGNFTNSTFGTSADFLEFAAGDINGDGNIDIVATNGFTIYKYTNNGSAVFAQTSVDSPLGIPADHIVLGDFNNNGSLDFVILSNTFVTDQAIYLNDGKGNFTAAASLVPIADSIVVADFNSDGYLDLATAQPGFGAKVLLNNGAGVFLESWNSGAGTVYIGAAADYDSDGDIDFVTGNGSNELILQKNSGAGTSFTPGTAVNANIDTIRSLSAGDFDNDGDVDMIVAGGTVSAAAGGARLFLNDGAGILTENGSATEITDSTADVAVGDIDGDGDLDYVRGNDAGFPNRHYKSDQSATSANTAPTAPSTGLAATAAGLTEPGTVVGDHCTFKELALSPDSPEVQNVHCDRNGNITWDSGLGHYWFIYRVDSTAPAPGCQDSDGTGGPQQSMNSFNLPGDGTYTVRICTNVPNVLATNNGRAFSICIGASCDSDSFRIRLNWDSGSDTQTPTRLLQYRLRIGTSSNANNILSGKTASPNYVSRVVPNGQSRTFLLRNAACGQTYHWAVATVDTGFKASWSVEQSFTVSSTCILTGGGGVSAGISPRGDVGVSTSTSSRSGNGAALLVNPLRQLKPEPAKTDTKALLLQDKQIAIDSGLQKKEQVGVVKPCLTIGPARTDEQGLGDIDILLSRLLDSHGLPLTQGLKLPGSALLSRSQFLSLLQRTQCVPILKDSELDAAVRERTRLQSPGVGMLEDVHLDSPDRPVAFSLMARGVPVGKPILGKLYGDMKTPILRSDAAQMMVSLIEGASEVGPLPTDITATSSLAESVGHLSAIEVLPAWFRRSFAPDQGLVSREAVLMLLRLSFSRGRIGAEATAPAGVTSPANLPWIGGRNCLVRDPTRAAAVRYTDVLPSSPLFPLVYDLGAIGIKGENGRTFWLLPGGLVKEHGILLGETALNPSEPVTMIEFLRALSILTCKGIESPDLMPDWIGGATKQRVARDRIADLPRNTSFTSRVFYSAQDHEHAYDLPLLRFAPVAFDGRYAAPTDRVNLDDGAAMIASAILYTQVKDRELTPIAAENQAGDLTQAILSFLRGEAAVSGRTLSRTKLLRILGAVVGGRGDRRVHRTDDEVWWERLK